MVAFVAYDQTNDENLEKAHACIFRIYDTNTYFSSTTAGAGAGSLLPPKSPPPLEMPNTDGKFATLDGAFSNPKIAVHCTEDNKRIAICKNDLILIYIPSG